MAIRVAVRDFSKIITDSPRNSHAYFQKGRALFDLGNVSDAIDAYNRALEQDGNFADAHFHKGIALLSLSQVENALPEFDRALELDPAYLPAYNNLGLVQFEQGAFAQAEINLRKAL